MPKIRHEAVVGILQNEPTPVLSLLACSGIHLRFEPRVTTTIANSDLSDRAAGDEDYVHGLFSDNVFIFEGDERRVAVIAEVQTWSRPAIRMSNAPCPGLPTSPMPAVGIDVTHS